MDLFLATVPTTAEWTFSTAIVMVHCNVFVIIVGYFAIQQTGLGPNLPVPQLATKKSFGLPELLATASLGHILGVGLILGLSNAGLF